MRDLWLACCGLLAACASDPKSPSKPAHSETTPKPVATQEPFALVRVDDSVDAFADISDDRVPFGMGVALYHESVALGPGHYGITHLARLVPVGKEGELDMIARFSTWADRALPLPPGDRFGFEDVSEYNESTRASTVIGLRTYVLTGEPILTHRDVAEAHILEGDEDVPQIDIAITLTSDGARKLADGTRSWAFRRIAIMTHGKIDNAPVVKSEIVGGHIELALGARSDALLARAKTLTAQITAN